MIRTNNPVIRKLKQAINGEEETIEDRALVEGAIANYFKEIYRRPDHMQSHNEVDE